MIFADNMYNHN